MKALISKLSFLFLFIIAAQAFAQDDMEKLKASIQQMNDEMTKATLAGDNKALLS